MKKVKELTSTGLTSQQIQTRPENVLDVVTDKDKYKKKDDIEEDLLYDVNDKDKVLDTDRKKLNRRRIVNKWESIFKESLSTSERKKLEKELDEIQDKIKKNKEWPDPKLFRREEEILSLLMSDGRTDKLRLKPGKPSRSQRVTSFTKERR